MAVNIIISLFDLWEEMDRHRGILTREIDWIDDAEPLFPLLLVIHLLERVETLKKTHTRADDEANLRGLEQILRHDPRDQDRDTLLRVYEQMLSIGAGEQNSGIIHLSFKRISEDSAYLVFENGKRIHLGRQLAAIFELLKLKSGLNDPGGKDELVGYVPRKDLVDVLETSAKGKFVKGRKYDEQYVTKLVSRLNKVLKRNSNGLHLIESKGFENGLAYRLAVRRKETATI